MEEEEIDPDLTGWLDGSCSTMEGRIGFSEQLEEEEDDGGVAG